MLVNLNDFASNLEILRIDVGLVGLEIHKRKAGAPSALSEIRKQAMTDTIDSVSSVLAEMRQILAPSHPLTAEE